MTASTLAIPATWLQAERLPGELPLYRVDLAPSQLDLDQLSSGLNLGLNLNSVPALSDLLAVGFGAATPLTEGVALTLVAESPVLAQQFDQDVLGDLVNAWSIFVKSGQIWALLIGIVVGYFIRNLTAY